MSFTIGAVRCVHLTRGSAADFALLFAETDLLDGPLRTLLAPIAVLLPGALIVTGMSELAAGVRMGESDANWLRGRQAAFGSLADVVREACSRWEKG